MRKASSAEVVLPSSPRNGAGADPAAEHPGSPPAAPPPGATGSSLSLWVWVGAGFLFLALLWTGMFIATRLADTRTVPLATQGGR